MTLEFLQNQIGSKLFKTSSWITESHLINGFGKGTTLPILLLVTKSSPYKQSLIGT